MNRRLAACLAATFVAGSILGTAGIASAATTLFVDKANGSCSDLGPGTSSVPFCSIQPAVDAARPGTNIQVNAGTYTEQVSVGPGRSGLKLRANGVVTIAAPNPMAAPGSIVRVTGSRPVRVAGFTIAGPDTESCGALVSGVRVDGDGKAFLSNIHITGIRAEPIGGCQFGWGILVGRNVDATTGDAVITDDVIDDYQKGGIRVDMAGSHAFVRRVTVTGSGPTAAIAQNGIQVANGAEAEIRDTTVTKNEFTGIGTNGSGILLFPSAGKTYLRDDTVSANDIDVWLFGTTGAKIVGVQSTGAVLQGVAVDDSSSGNLLKFLTATGNGGPDIEDDSAGSGTAGTANMWRHNTCGSSTPSGLCGP